MAHSPMPFNGPVLRVFAFFLIFTLIPPTSAHALRFEQAQDNPKSAAQLSAGMEEPADPEFLVLQWEEFLRSSKGMFKSFHGSWWTAFVGYLTEEAPKRAAVRLAGAPPKGILGDVHIPLVRLFDDLGELTPKIAEEQYADVKAILDVRIHTVESIQAAAEKAIAEVRGSQQQELKLKLWTGTAREYRLALDEFRKKLEGWRDRFQKLSAGAEEAIHQLSDFHGTIFTRIRQERPDLWDERFGRYTYTLSAPEEIAGTVQRLRQHGYLRNAKKAADLGSGQGAVVHVFAAATAQERIDVTGFEIDSALVNEARALTEELSKRNLVEPARIHWREESYLAGNVDLREYDLLFMNPSIEGPKGQAGISLGFMPPETLHKLIQKMKPGAILVFSGKTFVSPVALKESEDLEYLPEVKAFRRVGLPLETKLEQHLESAWQKIRDYEKTGDYTAVIKELQGLPEIPPAYRTAKIEQFLRPILSVQSRMVEFLGRPFAVHDASVPEGTRRQWVMAAAQMAAPLLVHRDLLPPESWDEKRTMATLLAGMMMIADAGSIPREAEEKYLLDPALHLPKRGVSFAVGSAASSDLARAAGQLLDRNEFSLHHPSIEWPMVKALAHYVIALSSEPTGVLAPSLEQDLLASFIGFVGSYYGIGSHEMPMDAMRARYVAPLERVVKELKLGPVPSELIRAVYREDKAAFFNLAAIGAEILARVADQVGDDTPLHEWAGYYAGEARALKHHRFFRPDLFPMAEPKHIESGMEEVKKVESAQKFLEEYQAPLRQLNLLQKAEVLAEREQDGLPMEVWVIPNRLAEEGIATKKVIVYVHADPAESQNWMDEISKRLPPVGEGKERLEFEVRPLLADGPLEKGVPTVIIKQLGASLSYHDGAVVVVFEDLAQIQRILSPQWVYSVAVNQSLRGKEFSLIDSIPLKDEIALYL